MKFKKTPDLKQAGTRREKLAEFIISELGHDREALRLVRDVVRLMAKRSRRPRR